MKHNTIAIVIFSYTRPDKLKSLIKDLLSQNYDISKIPVILFQDNSNDLRKLTLVRNCINNFQDSRIPLKVLRLRERNFGLKENIERGLNEVFKNYKRAIILEDDLRLSRKFLATILEMLDTYESDPKIASVTGMGTEGFQRTSRLRSRISCSIGWATWQDRWNTRIKSNFSILLFLFKKGRKNFDMNNTYPFSTLYLSTLFKLTSSWGIYWYICNISQK